MRLLDRSVLITGGARGLGWETAQLFVREGARVTVCDLRPPTDVALAGAESQSDKLFFVAADVSKMNQVQAMVDAAVAKFRTVDILINNAGITQDATLLKMTHEQWDRVIAVNLTGVFNCTKAVAPLLVGQGSGKIINTASIVGAYGNFGQTNYAAAKAGLIGMTKTWARELGPKGITVNAVAPGFIRTDMVAKMPENVLAAIRDRTPSRRLGEARDIANAYLYLASAEADFVNGAVLSVDGGLTL
jgi:3-oxoacyl-[acyl-carrier protein] reductase